MIFPKTIQAGEAVIRWNQNGTRNIIPGPKTIFAPFTRIEPLHRLNAAEGDYLVITYRDGHTEHQPGPCNLWFDPLLHLDQQEKEHQQTLAFQKENQTAEKEHREELLQLEEWNHLKTLGTDLTAVLDAKEHNPDKTIRLDSTENTRLPPHEAI